MTGFCLLWTGLLTQLFVREFHLHHVLSKLNVGNVSSIEVNGRSISNHDDVSAVVEVLRRPRWFSINHGGWADEVPLVIHLANGQTREFHVALYLRQTGAVLLSASNFDPHRSGWSNGQVFYDDLPVVLLKAGAALPDCQTIQTEHPCTNQSYSSSTSR